MKLKDAVNIGSRLELFVDDWLIEKMTGADLRLHHPVPREVAITFDREWEGNSSAYVTVFQDGDVFRMYYRGSGDDIGKEKAEHIHQVVCYAQSRDGIEWEKPELGLCEFNGSKQNNIVWTGEGHHNFASFKDTNPACKPEARYKALGSGKGGKLVAFQSADAIHWQLVSEEPVITKGAFDSQNLAFWDTVRQRYVEFHRYNDREIVKGEPIRRIMTCTSDDFLNWTEPELIDFGDAPLEQLYTNATVAYYRAPHIFLGFPKRFVPERKKVLDHPFPGVSDGVFMTSRDGLHWRRWLKAFIRPGLQRERWVQRNNMTAWGILATRPAIEGLPDELSLYSSEKYCAEGCCLRRYTLRTDGFVSVNAPYAGGEFTTRPFLFDGKELMLNYSTSAAGSLRVAILDGDDNPVPGFEMDNCPELYGDEIEAVVSWKDGSDVSKLAGRPIRLRLALKDADLYSIRFRS